ncbi:MAG: T9SS type A sorting domain-containing protein [Bacteroidetes bacterium]|nr:T9SS type A sorting domain-containing protein [Bacteroidota bacterium]
MAVGELSYTWNNAVIDSMIFSPNMTNNYLLTGTDSNGCVNTDSITIVVNALPIVTANASDTIICYGDSMLLFGAGAALHRPPPGCVGFGCGGWAAATCPLCAMPLILRFVVPVTLFGTGADSFSWTNAVIDSVAFYPIDTAMYIVTGIDINGCIGHDSILINANQIPFPILVFSGDTLYCTNVSGVNIYWYKDTVAIDSLTNYYVVTQNGNYEVFVVDSNGCAGADSMSMLNVSYLTPIKSDIIQVYPNPTQGLIHIEFEMKQAGEVDLMMNDLLGNKVYSSKRKILTSGKQILKVDLASCNLNTGIYFLNIFLNGKRHVVKVEYQK